MRFTSIFAACLVAQLPINLIAAPTSAFESSALSQREDGHGLPNLTPIKRQPLTPDPGAGTLQDLEAQVGVAIDEERFKDAVALVNRIHSLDTPQKKKGNRRSESADPQDFAILKRDDMAASQARLLLLIARKNDLELLIQFINQQRQFLGNLR